RRLAVQLQDLPEDPPPGGWPSLAVLLAARNEAGVVVPAVRSLLSQDYPGLEVVAVNDRSTDETGGLLDYLARGDGRLRVVHVQELPPGWLGKTHALQAGAESVTADWLLFTDADVVFAPGTLKKALALAVGERLDHLVVGPDVLTETLGERTFLATF